MKRLSRLRLIALGSLVFGANACHSRRYQSKERLFDDSANAIYHVCGRPVRSIDPLLVPEKKDICAENDKGTSGTAGASFAQSVRLRCNRVKGIQLASYPIRGGGTGWLLVELAKDSGLVLARSWIRVEKGCGVEHGEYMTFPLPELHVIPDGDYWINFEEFPDEGLASITNLGIDVNDPYKDGRLAVESREGWDARFRVLRDVDPRQWGVVRVDKGDFPPPVSREHVAKSKRKMFEEAIAAQPAPAPPDFRPVIYCPDGCIPRDDIPEKIRSKAPPAKLRNGLEILCGTSREYCASQPGCLLLSKSEFESLWEGRAGAEYFETALFAIAPCSLEEDYEEIFRLESDSARAAAARVQQPRLSQIMTELRGSWCGRETQRRRRLLPAEIRIEFAPEGTVIKGNAVMTWAKQEERPLGEDGYVTDFELYPMRLQDKEIVFVEASRYQSGRQWYLDPEKKTFHDGDPRNTLFLTRNCEGYWRRPAERGIR